MRRWEKSFARAAALLLIVALNVLADTSPAWRCIINPGAPLTPDCGPLHYLVAATAPEGNGTVTPASQYKEPGAPASFTIIPHAGFWCKASLAIPAR